MGTSHVQMQNTADDGIQTEEWVSLQAASSILGAPPTTVRRWGDTGKIPQRKTLGGHRRFLLSALLAIQDLEIPAKEVNYSAPLQSMVSFDTPNLDRQLTHQEWRMRMPHNENSERMRGFGQRLLGLLIQHINCREEHSRYLQDARKVGAAYGAEASAAQISLKDMTEAFLFFKQTLSRHTVITGMSFRQDFAELADFRNRLDCFMDDVLLGAIEGYEHGAEK